MVTCGDVRPPAAAPRRAKPRWRVASAAQQRKLDTLLYAKLLRRDPDVRSADLNRVMRVSLEPNDIPGYAIQRWHYEQIQLPGAWELTTGSAIPVAVVDTGIVAHHPELASKLIDGRDFIRDPTNPDGDGIDANPADPGCGISGGSIFHGTHVAGTIGARSNDGTGVAGVSWGARIMPIRALDGCAGTGSSFDIIQGIRYAAGLSNDSGTLPSQPAKVINLSFGASGTCDATAVELFEAVRAQGAVVVAAAGNENSSAQQTPASCPNVISVAARRATAHQGAVLEFWLDGRPVRARRRHDPRRQWRRTAGWRLQHACRRRRRGHHAHIRAAAGHLDGRAPCLGRDCADAEREQRGDTGADRCAARAGLAHRRHRTAEVSGLDSSMHARLSGLSTLRRRRCHRH